MAWKVPKIWEGGEVWIIGGGPSIVEQFEIPEEVIAAVIKGELPLSAYSPYMKVLHKKHVIGVNVAFLLGDWVDVVIFGDTGFYLKWIKELIKFPGLRVACNSHAEQDGWVKFVERDTSHPQGLSEHPYKVSWNLSSGGAAISLAANMGATRIMLLGFDMMTGENKMQHWHNAYGRGAIVSDRQKRSMPFYRHQLPFLAIAKDAERRGIEIINVSPNSAIKELPKITLKEALKLK